MSLYAIRWNDSRVTHVTRSEGVARKALDRLPADRVELVTSDDDGQSWARHAPVD